MRIAEQYTLLPQSLRYCYTTNITPTTTHNKHFLFVYKKRSRRKQRIDNQNKYINYLILIIIIITIIILWEPFPARVVCPGAGVCPWGRGAGAC